MLKDTQRSGQAGVRTLDLWVTSKVPCSRTHNTVVRPGFELTTFGLRVKCHAQGHALQWSGRGSNSRPLGYELSAMLKDTHCSGQAGVRTLDLWVTSKVPCSRTHNTVVRPGFELTTFGLRVKCLAQVHNAVVRPGFELSTFGLRVKCLAQGHTTQW